MCEYQLTASDAQIAETAIQTTNLENHSKEERCVKQAEIDCLVGSKANAKHGLTGRGLLVVELTCELRVLSKKLVKNSQNSRIESLVEEASKELSE